MPKRRAIRRSDLFTPPQPGEAVGEHEAYLQGRKDRFEVLTKLASGGMGDVFLGVRVHEAEKPGGFTRIDQEWAAVKMPREDIDDEARALFLREAEAAAAVEHPNVVRVLDWGDEPPFIAFERVTGGDLNDEISRRRLSDEPWSESELIDLYRQLVAAMKAINAKVVHRDLKPGNIFFEAGRLRVGDFGLAKNVDETTRTLTFKGRGTASYAAPEFWRSEHYTWAADQYSLGIVFYELAVLSRPFNGRTSEELCRQHLFAVPPLASEVRKEISAGLATMISRMMRKLTTERYPTWDEIDAFLAARELPKTEAPRLADEHVRKAAQHLQAITARELKEKEEAATRQRTEEERADLLKFWGDHVHANVSACVAPLNSELGLSLEVTRKRNEIQFSFLKATLLVHLSSTPVEVSEMLAWGDLRLRTPKNDLFSHVLLHRDRANPYGRWCEVEITPHVLLGHQKGIEKLELIGRIFRAPSWRAFEERRNQRQSLSITEYKEKALEWETRIRTLIEILIAEAQ